MNCIVIEDQPPAQRILKKYIDDIGTLNLKATFADAVQAIGFLQTEQVELIFLDIHLPKMSGMDFLKSLRQAPHVILTTAFPDFALESYDYNVVDYLLKPFSFQRFVKAVAKVPQPATTLQVTEVPQKQKDFFIKSGYDLIKVSTDEILYIKSEADYTEIVTREKKHLSAESLKYWLETLASEQFFRVHKSYIVNTAHVEKISSNHLFLSNGENIAMGRVYKDDFLKRFLK